MAMDAVLWFDASREWFQGGISRNHERVSKNISCVRLRMHYLVLVIRHL
jgi:hypothetical protein